MALTLKSYIPLSSPETFTLIARLTQRGMPMDEAVEQIALINHMAKTQQQPASTVLEDWIAQQQKTGGRRFF